MMTYIYDVVDPNGKIVLTTTEIKKARAMVKKDPDLSIESWRA